MPTVQTWNELVKTALLGTERQAPPPPDDDAGIGTLLAQMPGDDRERLLLAESGALTLARRAGYVPQSKAAAGSAPETATAPVDDLPLCREAAARDLPMVLDGEYEGLLPEWLSLVGARGERAPARWLPDLLDRGAKNKELRPALYPVFGKRGLWLAAQNPAWRYALGKPQETADPNDPIWETGVREERVAYLEALRGIDPEAARRKLETVWDQEPPEIRSLLLATLRTGLSMADEPFLEAALDDRRKEVRTSAQDLLRTLPDSRLCQRMAERAKVCISRQRKLLISSKLVVELPSEAFEKAMSRDGIEQKPSPYLKIGERAYWLGQILAATPLRVWPEHLGCAPEEAVRLAIADSDWREMLLTGWTRALANEPGVSAWAEPLLSYWMEQGSSAIPTEVSWQRVLTRDRIEQIVIQNFDFGDLYSHYRPLGTLLDECATPWSIPLATKTLEVLNARIGSNKDYTLIHALQRYADRFPEQMLPQLYAAWKRAAGDDEYPQRQLGQHAARTEFRRQMRSHITGE